MSDVLDEAVAKAQQIIDMDRGNFQGPMQLGNALHEIGEAVMKLKRF